MSSNRERFADHALVRRLDSGGDVEFHEARSLRTPEETHLLIRFPAHAQRFPPWAWPDVARYIVHPNVLQLLDFLTVQDRDTAILEFVPGVDLRELLQQRTSPLPPGLACFVAQEVCRGLAAGVSARAPGGPLHATLGNLTPRSIRLSRTGQVKVGFFCLGRLKPEGEPMERLDERVLFLAPEQATGQADATPGPQVDVFLTGAILQQLLAGTPLGIAAKTPAEYVRALVRHSGKTFLKPQLRVSATLSQVLAKMLARDPKDRFTEASEVVLALDAVPELNAARGTAREDLAGIVEKAMHACARGTLGATT